VKVCRFVDVAKDVVHIAKDTIVSARSRLISGVASFLT